ncbi:MAG: AMP-binding protein [Proteobacteria bacterium]|nr:AMP-binding protein [Pseudomonadota bacterium]
MDELHDLRRHAAAAPQRCALVFGDQRITYGELEALANRLAAVLRARGLRRGEHIASLIGNRPEALALAWAAWRCGLYLTPLSTALAAPELQHIVADCEARALLADAEFAPLLAAPDGWPAGLQRLAPRGGLPGFDDLRAEIANASPQPAADEPPGALMMYTSGTTGAPKGVIRPLLPAGWRGTPPFAADLIALFGIGGAQVRYLSTAPLYHAAPLRFALAVTAGGGTAVVMDRFDADGALALLAREAITHSQWVPAMFQRLLALPAERRAAFSAPAHQCAIHGAAPCPPAVKRAMLDWWGPILLEYYSGSEGVGLTMIDAAEWLAHPGSVGRARKGRLHIVDESGRELAPGETGLVCFSGIAPFAYHNAPEKTAARSLRSADGLLLQTFGDLGHADAEGRLSLSDRLDDMIISGGVNVYPQEIEAVLRRVAGVWDCAVVGMPDERFGERPVAFIVARHGEDEAALRETLAREIESRLGRIKRPDALHFVAELPRTPTGKLLRRRLRGWPASRPPKA